MKSFLLFGLFPILFCACQKESVEIPDTGRKIVINGLITTDSLLNVRISNSNYFKDTITWWATRFDSAEVCIYQNDIFLDSLYYSYKAINNSVYPSSNYNSRHICPQPGNEYKIIVRRPGFSEATSITRIPKLVKIEKIDTSKIVARPGSGIDFVMNCSIEFTDPPDEKNFYLFNIIKIRMSPFDIGYTDFDCHDPIVEEELGSSSFRGKVLKYGYAFSDKLVDGKKYSLKVSFDGYFYRESDYNPFPRTSYKYFLRLYSVTEDYFKFIKTLNLFNATYMNPLTEPVMVYSNVSGGYGIFGGAAVSTDSIILHD